MFSACTLPLLPPSAPPPLLPSFPRSRLTTLFSIGLEEVRDPAKRTNARKEIAKVAAASTDSVPFPLPLAYTRLCIRQVFTEKHMEGKNAWFFSKLRF